MTENGKGWHFHRRVNKFKGGGETTMLFILDEKDQLIAWKMVGGQASAEDEANFKKLAAAPLGWDLATKILKIKWGENVMREKLCPICSHPGKHEKGCPYPIAEKFMAQAKPQA